MIVEHVMPIIGPMTDNIDTEMMPEGYVHKRVNMRPDNTGDVMSNVPIPGNVAVSMTLPDGTNKTVGWCKDTESNGIIWFVYNTLGNHCIFRYNGTLTNIFYEEPTLGLTDNMVIAEVVDGRLYWNDGVAEPKSFNIQKAIDYTARRGGYINYKPFDTIVFPMIKKPPVLKPQVAYESLTENEGVTIDFNNLRKKQWQFKYNYEYEDYQESVYSVISKIPLPEAEVSPAGKWSDDITWNNSIKVTVNTGNRNVKAINVAVRDASQNNLGPFFIFKKIDKWKNGVQVIPDNITYDVSFLNNTYVENIDTDYGNAYYHDVPLKAKDMLLLDGKVLAMTNPTVGYEKVNVNFDVEYVDEEVEFTSNTTRMQSSSDKKFYQPWDRCGLHGTRKTTINVYVSQFYADSIYRMTIKFPEAPVGYETPADIVAEYVSGAVEPDGFRAAVAESFYSQIEAALDNCETIPMTVSYEALGSAAANPFVKITFAYGINLADTTSDNYKRYMAWLDPWMDALEDYNSYIYGEITSAEFTPSFKSLKRGQYHTFGIVYNDSNGRYNVVMDSKDLYVDPVSADNIGKVAKAKLTINSLPPTWATSYKIAYIPNNSYTYLMEVPLVEVLSGGSIPAGQKFLKINQAILSMIESFPNNTIEAYEWQNGDRIRQVGEVASYEILKEFTREYDDGGETQTESGFLVEADFDLVSDKITLIEIYRPNRTPQSKVFYETGDEYMIVNGYHQGDVSQTASVSAEITLDFGDVYLRQRYTSGTPAYAIVEDSNFSDYYISSGIDIGRPVLKTDIKQSTLNRVVTTENYIQNTKINRLNVMLPGAENKEVSEMYGYITKILERGDTLKVLQPHKETSVYIGKNYAKDANGGDIVLVSDKTFGSTNVYENSWGTMYPRSVVQSDDFVYFFDSTTGDFLRSATNGTLSLPKEYGYQKYFDEKVRLFNKYTGQKDIITSISPNDQTVYIIFLMNNIEIVAFSEREGMKGFMFFLELAHKPENFAWYGDKMYSFLNGRLYEHGLGDKNKFYGSGRLNASIAIISNRYPEVNKTYEALSVDTNGQWEAMVEIEKDNNYQFGQFTRILKAMFRSIEGRLYSAIPRNIYNRAGVASLQNLYSGNKMSGDSVKITLNSVNFDKLREVKVISQV